MKDKKKLISLAEKNRKYCNLKSNKEHIFEEKPTTRGITYKLCIKCGMIVDIYT